MRRVKPAKPRMNEDLERARLLNENKLSPSLQIAPHLCGLSALLKIAMAAISKAVRFSSDASEQRIFPSPAPFSRDSPPETDTKHRRSSRGYDYQVEKWRYTIRKNDRGIPLERECLRKSIEYSYALNL